MMRQATHKNSAALDGPEHLEHCITGVDVHWRKSASAVLAIAVGVCVTQTALHAAPSDCIESGGQTFCGAPVTSPWLYQLCDEAPANLFRAMAWCFARGGTQNGFDAPCIGATEPNESNVRTFAFNFAQRMHSNTCSWSGDSGWGHTSLSTNCWSGPPTYKNNILVGDHRKFSFTCTSGGNETDYAQKGRDLACPAGYTPRFDGQNNRLCSRPIESAGCPALSVGNPVTIGTGIKTEREADFAGAGDLQFMRYYHGFGSYNPVNAVSQQLSQLGYAWRSNFDKRVIPITNSATMSAAMTLPNGDIQYFDVSGRDFYNYNRSDGQLATTASGFRHVTGETIEDYDDVGRLISITSRDGQFKSLAYSTGATPTAVAPYAGLLIQVTDHQGRTLNFVYDAMGRVVSLGLPDGSSLSYAYDGASSVVLPGQRPVGNLTTVRYPDGTVRTYWYNEQSRTANTNLPGALTGIQDENNARYAAFTYDAAGRATASEHAGGAGRHVLTYGASATTVTDPLGTQRTYNFTNVLGVVKSTGQSQPGGSGCGPASSAVSYDANGNVASRQDFKGNKTCYAYDLARNLETQRVEGLASGTACSTALASPPAPTTANPVRALTTAWHPDWRLEMKRAEPKRLTHWIYNGQPDPTAGNATANCAPASALLPDGKPIAVLCKKIEQATLDESGAAGFAASASGSPRVWNYTYNGTGQVFDGRRPEKRRGRRHHLRLLPRHRVRRDRRPHNGRSVESHQRPGAGDRIHPLRPPRPPADPRRCEWCGHRTYLRCARTVHHQYPLCPGGCGRHAGYHPL